MKPLLQFSRISSSSFQQEQDQKSLWPTLECPSSEERECQFTLPTFLSTFCFVLLFGIFGMNAQITYSTAGSNYVQNFDNLYGSVPANNTTVAATTLPTGWLFVESGTNANTTLRNDNGSSGTGDTYLDGATNSNERSFGSYASGSLTSQFGSFFTNSTGSTLTQFTLTYTGEQWKDGGSASSVLNTLNFAYAVNPTSLTVGTYTNVSNLNFTALVNNTSADVTTDGNAANRRTTITFTVTGISWPDGQTLYLRWSDPNDAGNDDNLAIDDLTFSATTAAAPAISTTGSLSAVNTIYGTASANTTFTASGTNLTNNILVAAPAGFEVSKTAGGASGFAATQTLAQSGGTVLSTTIYVRLAATTVFGNYSGNVTLASSPAATVNVATTSSAVSKKGLTVSGATANNKIYDRTTIAIISGATASGTVNGDAITISGDGSFADFNVGTAKPVTPSLTFSGTNASSYTLAQPSGLNANITAKNLTISGATANNKVYDGNTDAVLNGTLSGVISPDDVTLNSAASFDSASIGTAIPVTSSSTLVGVDIANYNLVQPVGLSANITAKSLTISGATAQNKVFDGNNSAVITGTLVGVVSPDDVTLVGTGTFATSAVGNNIPVTSTSTIVGDIANYTLTQPIGLTANISSQPLQPQTITFNPLTNVVYGDSLFNLTATASSNLAVAYVSSNTSVATISGNTVTIVGAGTTTITASQSGNGTYDSAPTVDQPLNVLAKALTATASPDNKIYDGNNTATISGTLNGIVGSDVVTFLGSGVFASVTVANAISVTSASALGGANAANYTLTQPTGLSANITPKSLTVSGAVASNKIYDGSTSAIINGASLNGILGSDVVTVAGSGTFASSNVGSGISVNASLTLSGSDSFNYTLIQPSGLSANITPASLSITGLTGNTKVYDKTTTASLSGTPVLNGVIGSDIVSVSGTPVAVFNNKNVGVAKPISVTGYSLAGAQAGNYTALQPIGITGNITPASLTITSALAQDKPFDGTTAATITGTLSGVISPDVVTLVGTGTFASAAIGSGIAVTSTSTLAGIDGPNYVINPQPTGLTANITPGPTVLAVGDLSIIGFQLNSPDTFTFVTWVDIASGTLIKFCDNPFNSSGSANILNNVRGGENFVIWKNNGAVIPAGTVITVQDNTSSAITNNGSIVSGNLSGLSASGDNIFAYQGPATSGATPDYTSNANPTTFNGTVLFGIYMQGSATNTTWITTGTVTTNNSYLPSQLNVPNGNIALGSLASRGQYTGSRSNQTSYTAYKSLVTNAANWTTAAGAGTITMNTTSFTLATPPSASLLTGSATICSGSSTNLSVAVTGGTSPFTLVYTDGNSNFTVNGYVSGTAISVAPTSTTTYTIVSVTDANTLSGTGNSGAAVITVNTPANYYADADGDGYGNSANTYFGCAQAGYVLDNTDCNDSAAAINPGHAEVLYNGVDDNCNGQLDEGFQITTQVQASQCGTTLSSVGSLISAVSTPQATGYRFEVTNTTTNSVQIIETGLQFFSLTMLSSYDYATTYAIRVMLKRNGIWLGYFGSSCLVSTPAILAQGGAAQVTPSQCGITLPSISTLISTTSLAGVTGYRFRITNITDGLAPNQIQIIDRPLQWFNLTMLATYNYGTTYNVEVAVKTNGSYSGFGSPCSITSPAVPSLTNCGATAATATSLIYTVSLAKVTSYRFEFTNLSSNQVLTIDRALHFVSFSNIPGFSPATSYGVRVAVMTSGVFSPFGDVCEITSPGAGRIEGPRKDDTQKLDSFSAVAYPNPFIDKFSVNVNSDSTEDVNIKIYDMTGRLIETLTRNVDDIQIGNNYPSGIYNVIINQGGNIKTLRLIKR